MRADANGDQDSMSKFPQYEHLDLQSEGPVVWATLNRPYIMNALNPALVEELRDFFTGMSWRHDIRVIVLRGAGRNFCAGLDLKAASTFKSVGPSHDLIEQRRVSEIVMAMRRCPQPIIVLLDGAAAGGGFALALAADIRIGTPTTRMNAAPIRIGLSACDIGISYFLPRMVGSSVAAEYMMTGRFIDAKRACELGLISRVVDADDLDKEARSLLQDMLRASPLGLRLTKETLTHSIDAGNLEAVVAMEDRTQTLCVGSGDFNEGVAAFVEHRMPNYTGK
jgi:enoyl-CoA hydratase/carnithine racemase